MAPLLASEFDRGRYLKATDLTGDTRFKIKAVTVEALGQDKERKLVVWFTNDSRGLVMNKTNIRALTPVLGDDTRTWAGSVITVFPTTTTLGANTVPCLRVRPPKAKPVPESPGNSGKDFVQVSVAAPEPAPSVLSPSSLKDELDDDIGF
jgi:hypothetical protein